MGSFLLALTLIAGGIFGSALAKVLADDFKAWRPTIVRRLIKIAASMLAEGDRDRYHEEWAAYVDEIPGDLARVLAAGGFIWTAFRISDRRYLALGTKRLMDLSVALSSIVALAPTLILIALAIKLESRGPAIFAQLRVGKDGKEFKLYKFRSMQVFQDDQSSAVTPIGRLLRKTSLDELPQMWNIIKGDMSLVGPGALPPQLVQDGEAEHYLSMRNKMRPGLTGLGQISAFGSRDREHLGQSDVRYVLEHSTLLDIKIIARSIVCFFRLEKL